MLGLQKKVLRPIVSHCEELSNQRVEEQKKGINP